jgi:hypothetical protein
MSMIRDILTNPDMAQDNLNEASELKKFLNIRKKLARQRRLPSAPASGPDLQKRTVVPVGQVPVRELRRYSSRPLCAVIAAHVEE